MKNKNDSFMKRRLDQMLSKMTIIELKVAVNQGLAELLSLVELKPKNWTNEIDSIEKTLRILKNEIDKREQKGE